MIRPNIIVIIVVIIIFIVIITNSSILLCYPHARYIEICIVFIKL